MTSALKTIEYRIVLSRHGQSEWNRDKLICGWYDANLTDNGVGEARKAGRIIETSGLKFDVAHTSLLRRARQTLELILEVSEQETVPICEAWQLNERNFGGITGLSRSEVIDRYGAEKVKAWEGYNDRPPPMCEDHTYFKSVMKNPTFEQHNVDLQDLPKSESLSDTYHRVVSYWNDVIVPSVKQGKHMLIVAHSFTLRCIIKHIENLSEDALLKLNLPTATPFVYEFDDNFQPVTPFRFIT